MLGTSPTSTSSSPRQSIVTTNLDSTNLVEVHDLSDADLLNKASEHIVNREFMEAFKIYIALGDKDNQKAIDNLESMLHGDANIAEFLDEIYSLCVDNEGNSATLQYIEGFLFEYGYAKVGSDYRTLCTARDEYKKAESLGVARATECYFRVQDVLDGIRNYEAPLTAEEFALFKFAKANEGENYKLALDTYISLADKGNKLALAELERMLKESVDRVSTYGQSKEWQYCSGLTTSREAMYVCGKMVWNACYDEKYNGDITDGFKQTFSWFQKGSKLGSPTATYYLGVMSLDGLGTKKNVDQGEAYLIKASDIENKEENFDDSGSLTKANDAESMEASFMLGMLYWKGEKGVSNSQSKARKFFRDAHKQGHPNAAFYCAQSYATASWKHWTVDHVQIEKWYRIAARTKGDTQEAAKEALAKYDKTTTTTTTSSKPQKVKHDMSEFEVMESAKKDAALISAEVVEKAKAYEKDGDNLAAINCCLVLADMDDKKALQFIYSIVMRSKGPDDDIQSSDEFKHCITLADGNSPAAMYICGMVFYPQYKDARNNVSLFKQTKKYFSAAAELGFISAINSLGTLYLARGSFDKNCQKKYYEKGINFLRRADYEGSAEATFNFGALYLDGSYGMQKDIKKALTFLNKASQMGHGNASFLLGELYSSGEEGINRDHKKARIYFALAHEQKHLSAAYNCGKSFATKDSGGKPNLIDAHYWYGIAAAQGDKQEEAKAELAKLVRVNTNTTLKSPSRKSDGNFFEI